MFSVCMCAHFQANPKESHLSIVKRIFIYLKGTPHMGLWHPKLNSCCLVGYINANYANGRINRKITSVSC